MYFRPWYLGTPHNLRCRTVSKIITESMAQLSLSNPGIARGSGETSKTMADRSLQSESLVFPHPNLAHFCRPNLTGKHQLSIIRRLVFQHHPGCSGHFSGNCPYCYYAIGFGFFSIIEPLRQRFILNGKVCGLRKSPG